MIHVLVVIIVLSTLAGLVGRPRVRLRQGWGHPGVWLLGVTALIYLNQVLFTVYVLRVHNGDATFVSRYLPEGWFELADLGWLAAHFPAPELLSFSVLRVQAFLELSFVVFAYLTVCRWFAAELYRRAAETVWLVAVSYTATFSLIELSLSNPYTTQDIVLRVLSMVVVGLVVPKLNGPTGSAVTGAKDLVLFLVSIGAMGTLVLAVYDTALLYNLGHIDALLPFVIPAAVLLVAVRLADKPKGAPPGPGIAMLIRTLAWFLTYFAVSALAIRYGLIFGAPWVAMVAGVVVVGAAVFQALRKVRVTTPWLVEMAGATAAGMVAAYFAYEVSAGYPELRLLLAVAAFCTVTVATCTIVDRAYSR
jgi:hypothetical protein